MFNPNKDASFESGFKKTAKASIQKLLFVRLALAAIVIAVVLSVAVFLNERQKVGGIVIERARQVASRFNHQIVGLLDNPGLSDESALQRELQILFIAGNLEQWIGHLVSAVIFDKNGERIALVSDEAYLHIREVEAALKAFPRKPPDLTESGYAIHRIAGAMYVHVSFPLFDSRGAAVARAEGMVAVSPSVVEEIEGRILRTILEVVLVVFCVTLLLYPIFLSLVGRLSTMTANLLDSNLETLRVLGSAVAKRDSDTDLHNYRVAIYAVRLAEAVDLKPREIRKLIKGAFLHDVGKIGISDSILLKPDRLTPQEFEVMKSHVGHGTDIVERSDWLKDAVEVVAFHHEQFSGGEGYPSGINGSRIPLTARIFAVADVFDALTSKRPYKEPYGYEAAVEILIEKRGRHFDPLLVDRFLEIVHPLYLDLSNGSIDKPRKKLEAILQRYFAGDII